MARTWWLWRVLVVLTGVASALGQSIETSLHQMTDAAGVIFVGQVQQVRFVDGGGTASGVFEVKFRVDRAVRECVTGTYVLREWAGLWAGGAERYRVGQRLLMLLRTPNAAGLSSPVGGLDGAIPISGVESAVTGAAPSSTMIARPVAMVDLRWIAARVSRPVAYAGSARGGGKVLPLIAESRLFAGENGADVVLPVVASTTVGAAGAAGASVDAVVQMLGSWEHARAAQ